jgi:hypothetical protein
MASEAKPLPILVGVAVLVLAGAIGYRVIMGRSEFNWNGPLGEITLGTVPSEPVGGPGAARPGTNQTVWESECPARTKAISGTCISQSGNVPLQNIGPNGNKWECAWAGPMPKADVQALCFPQSD